jgi:exopolysaccharide production repressor protein
MPFRVFLSNLLGASLVFGLVSYLYTGSWKTTLIQTAICAILMQIGYFVSVVFLLHKSRVERGDKKIEGARPQDAPSDDNQSAKVH